VTICDIWTLFFPSVTFNGKKIKCFYFLFVLLISLCRYCTFTSVIKVTYCYMVKLTMQMVGNSKIKTRVVDPDPGVTLPRF
jgi:hypothetical protein